jgi:hypothetical protein
MPILGSLHTCVEKLIVGVSKDDLLGCCASCVEHLMCEELSTSACSSQDADGVCEDIYRILRENGCLRIKKVLRAVCGWKASPAVASSE